jgi:hypothetical protein
MYKKRENKRGGERERERERDSATASHSPISNTTIPPKGIKSPPFTPTRREKKKTNLARLSLDEHLQNNSRLTWITTCGHWNPA